MLKQLSNIKNLFSEKIFLIVLLLLSVFLNLFMTFEIRNLKAALSLIRNETKEHQIILGKTVSSLNVQNLKGENIKIDYKDTRQPTVIYVFSPDCIWCERNLQNTKYLYEKTQNQYHFIGLSLQKDSADKYSQEKELLFPVYYNPSDLNRIEYNFRATPATFVISPEGKVGKLWSGAYDNATLEDIENFFELKLPGLNE